MRKSLLPPRTPGSSKNANGEGGRCTEFVALIDHADLVDTSSFNFTEHVNRDGARVFELNNPVQSNVRHIGTEDTEDGDNDYCVAFFNRRTKQTEYKPISFLRVAPRVKKEVEESGLLEGKLRRSIANYSQNNVLTTEEYREKRNELTMQWGNDRKRKILEATLRRKIDDSSMSIMNDSLITNGDTTMDTFDGNTTAEADDMNKSTNDISLLQTPESMVLPKMNLNAKTPDEVFKLEDFFTSEDLPVYLMHGKLFFNTHSTLDAVCKLGAPKFIGLRVLEARHLSDLHAAVALKLLVLGVIVPRGHFLVANVTVQALSVFSPQIALLIESEFMRGKLRKDKRINIEKTYKSKILSHMFAMYFALAPAGNYSLPLSVLNSELQTGDNAVKKLLQDIGCAVQTATPDEVRTHKTKLMARLVGVIRAGARKGGRGRGRLR